MQGHKQRHTKYSDGLGRIVRTGDEVWYMSVAIQAGRAPYISVAIEIQV